MLRRCLLLASLVLVTVLLAVWQFGYHGVDPRLIFHPPPPEGLPPPAANALDELAAVNVKNVPLADVLKQLSERHHVTIELDSFAVQDGFVTGKELVTCRLSKVKLSTLLERMLKDLNLIYRDRDGVIYVTSNVTWNTRLQNYVGRVYRLDRLLGGPFPVNEEKLADIITMHIAPSTWAKAAGAGEIRTLPGAIVVSQTPDVHERIAELLDQLGALAEADDPVALAASWQKRELNGPIERALSEPTDIEAKELPLRELIDQLARRHHIEIQIDDKSLDGVGVSRDTPITCTISGISLRSALAIVLKDLDLTYMVRDNVLQITSPEIADYSLILVPYPVGDLLVRDQGLPEYDTLIDLIKSTVIPTSWADAGGGGFIDGIGGALIITQPSYVHEPIQDLLFKLRYASLPKALAGPPPAPQPSIERLRRALERPVSFDFDRITLAEAARQLTRLSGVNVLLDIKQLDGIGMSPDDLVIYTAENAPLKRVLRRIRMDELVPVIQLECLFLTTHDAADNMLETRVYRAAGALASARRVAMVDDMDLLMDVITAVVNRTSWADEGGAGEVRSFGNLLVVRQTANNHDLVEAFIQKTTRLLRSAPAAQSVEIGEDGLDTFVRLYDVRDLAGLPLGEDPTVAHMLQRTLFPDADETSVIYPYERLAAARCIASEHQRIEQLLSAIRSNDPSRTAPASGGGAP